jgi:hypothetical protein
MIAQPTSYIALRSLRAACSQSVISSTASLPVFLMLSTALDTTRCVLASICTQHD